jgi:hypothetical protein
MMRKKRGYKREVELVRDYKLFAIACEGGKREPDYFKAQPSASRSRYMKVGRLASIELSLERKRKNLPTLNYFV